MQQTDLARHAARFQAMLDQAFRTYGDVPEGTPAPLRDAVATTPRHKFVHRFRLDASAVHDFDADPARHLATIYSDEVMAHVDAQGDSLPSTNSQPSYVLWLLHLLGVERGQHVLEIGSGSGWLAGIMSHLVGPEGSVTGVEIIPELAARSRADLAAIGVTNVSILARDATCPYPPDVRFDRVMITAGVWDLPAALFTSVEEGGKVLAPIEQRDGGMSLVTVLRRTGDRFVAERTIGGAFVPLVGSSQTRQQICRLEDLPLWNEIGAASTRSHALPLGRAAGEKIGDCARAFRAFLGRTQPDFAIFATGQQSSFGLLDQAGRSVAVWRAGELYAYGDESACRRLIECYRIWTAHGLPGSGSFDFEIVRAGASPRADAGSWIEPRHDTALIWRLKPGVAALS